VVTYSVCGKPLRGRQKVACSDPCRAKANRRRRGEALAEADRELALAVEALKRTADRLRKLRGARSLP